MEDKKGANNDDYPKIEIEFILIDPLEIVDNLNLALHVCIDSFKSDTIDINQLHGISESIREITRNIIIKEIEKSKS